MNKEEFRNELLKREIPCDDEVINKFELYLKLLQTRNQTMNLTSIDDEEGIWEKHFLDSLSFYEDIKDKESLIDVGTGAGFPGIPIKIVCPGMEVTLIDATKKKCDFLEEVIDKLELKKIKVKWTRAEEIAHQGLRKDVVTARAVSSLRVLLELCAPLAKMKGTLILMKGPNGLNEIKEAENAAKVLGVKLIKSDELELPNKEKRINIFYEKYKPTDKLFPRKYSDIKKKPL